MSRTKITAFVAPVSLGGLVESGARRIGGRVSRRISTLVKAPSACRAGGLGIAIRPLLRANPDLASDIYRGRFAFGETIVECKGHLIFEHQVADPAFVRELHGFAWLNALQKSARGLHQVHARALIGEWAHRARQFSPLVWRSDVAARRLISWTQHAEFLINGAPGEFEAVFLNTVTRHVRHLNRVLAREPMVGRRLQIAIALVYASLGFSGLENSRQNAYGRLAAELTAQILPDGGHVSRNPSILLDLLLDLLPLRAALEAAHLEVPEELNLAIERMAPMLRFFCHDDGGLAVFNGVAETRTGAARAAIDADTTFGRPVTHAVHSGFCRLQQGACRVLMDIGRPPAPGLNPGAASDPLAMEFSDGGHRIVVNCGTPPVPGSAWDAVARKTAAHSTVCLDNRSAGLILADRLTQSVFGTPVVIGPSDIWADVQHDKQGSIVEAGHDGYHADYGIMHQRRLFLSPCGSDLRGEDSFLADLENPGNLRTVPFAVRFHLHPSVKATLSMDAASVMLMLPNKSGWRFSARGGRLRLEDSVYLPGAGITRKTKQIVVEGLTGRPDRVQWAFKKIARRKPNAAAAKVRAPQLPL